MDSKEKVKESLAGMLAIVEGYCFYKILQVLSIDFKEHWLPISVLFLFVFFCCNHVISQGVDMFDKDKDKYYDNKSY